jgi:hypothetical protein
VQIYLNRRWQAIESINTARLVTIETYIAILQYGTNPELLQCIRALFCQLITLFCVADSLDTAGKAVIFSIGCLASLKAALHFNSAIVRIFVANGQ